MYIFNLLLNRQINENSEDHNKAQTSYKNSSNLKVLDRSKSRGHNIGVIKIMCNYFNRNSNHLKMYFETKNYLIEKLSVENIIRQFINFDILKQITLSNEGNQLFKSIPKQTVNLLKKIHTNNLIFENSPNNINIPYSPVENLQNKENELDKLIEFLN